MHVRLGILILYEWPLWATALLFALLVILLIWVLVKNAALRKQVDAEVKEKQQIISIISHDIKAPFNRVLTLAQLIALEKPPLSDTQKDFLDKIHQTIADGLNLMRNLVDYRNILYRNMEIVHETVNISDLVKAAVINATSLAHKKQLKIITDIMPEIKIVSDHICISRAVDNLLANAIKFSPSMKEIGVLVRETEQEEVLIQIKDQGPGFTQDDMGKMYNRFQQLSALPTAGETSTGLGLFITRSMVERVGGKIQCITTEGSGSTFIIRLPSLA